MRRWRRLVCSWILVCISCVLTGLSHRAAAQATAPAASHPAATNLTPEAMEAFLQNGRIGSRRAAGGGVTNSIRATLTDGTLMHDAQIQTIDVSQNAFQAGRASEVNFKDSYRFNIAGYRLSRLLGMDNVPVSVERPIEGKMAAVTWWLDDVQMTERERLKKGTAGPNASRTALQLQVMRVFDELIQNKDRNQGNIVWTGDWKMWLIDHTRAFRLGTNLLHPTEMKRCDRALLQHLRELTPEALEAATKTILTKAERDAVMARRDRIVKHFEERIASAGEAAVLFDL